MTALLTFPLPLLRLILCGGGGLQSAWGPLVNADDGEYVAWNPDDQIALYDAGGGEPPYRWRPLTLPSLWSMPLGADHPWAARLAILAAWMLGRKYIIGASVEVEDDYHLIMLSVSMRAHLGGKNDAEPMFMRGHVSHTLTWGTCGGTGDTGAVDLPTLPTHLAAHPPVVALLLALYDVPEVRARVDAVRP